MGYVKSSRPTEKVKLVSNEKYWVEVLTELRYGDIKAFAKPSPDGSVDFVGAADKFLETIIVDWNLDDEAGKKIEVNPENINQLTQEDAELLMRRLGGMVSQPVDAKKNSSQG